MRLGQLRRLAEAGDLRAQQTLVGLRDEASSTLGQLARAPEALAAELTRHDSAAASAAREVGDLIAREKQRAVERQNAMLAEMAQMRTAMEAALERATVAENRAAKAHAREQESAARSERRERLMLRLMLASVAIAVISTAGVVAAIFVQ